MKFGKNNGLRVILYAITAITLATITSPVGADEPFKLGVEEKGYVEPRSGIEAYPAPQMMGQPLSGATGASAAIRGQATSSAPIQGQATRPLQMGIQKVVLPPQFMGVWNVQGQRTKIQAQPEFQAGAENAFAISTQNTWEIGGDANRGYSMSSNTGARTLLIVDKVAGNTAFIRYQHQIKNTTAQEAIVMQLAAGGVQFSGLERISIIKENAPPRAQVTYQLAGYRQR